MPADADRTGAQTRDAIIETAARTFWAKGYELATLGEIADELGITRSAVLHHFASKATLLGEVMAPLVAALDELLDRREAAGRLTARTRRPFLVDLVNLVCDHPAAAGIMAFDPGVRFHLDEELQIGQRAQRFAAIVSVAQGDDYAVVRAPVVDRRHPAAGLQQRRSDRPGRPRRAPDNRRLRHGRVRHGAQLVRMNDRARWRPSRSAGRP